MINLKVNAEQINCSNKNELVINIPNSLKNVRIVDAILNISIASIAENEKYTINFSCDNGSSPLSWENVDTIKAEPGDLISINLSDEINEALNVGATEVKLSFTKTNQNVNDISFFATSENEYLNIDYISLSEFRENSTSHSIDLKNAGNLSVDLVTGNLRLTTPLVSSDNNVLPLSISNNFVSNKKEKEINDISSQNTLSLQRFLIRHKDKESLYFTYIDEEGKEQIIEEKYYYLDNDQKIYVPRDELSVNVEGDLEYKLKTDKYDVNEVVEYGDSYVISTLNDINLIANISTEILGNPTDICELHQNLTNLSTNNNILSLNVYNGNVTEIYKCTSFNKQAIERKKSNNSGSSGVVFASYIYTPYTAYRYNLIFENDKNETISITIDYDPLNENSLPGPVVVPVAESNPSIDTTTTNTKCNYYLIKSSKDINISNLNILKQTTYVTKNIDTSLESPNGLTLVSSFSDVKDNNLVDYEVEELANLREQIKQLKKSIKTGKEYIESNQDQLCILAIEKEYTIADLNDQVSNDQNTGFKEDFYKNTKTEEEFKQFIEEKLTDSISKYVSDNDIAGIFYRKLVNLGLGDVKFCTKNIYSIDEQIDSTYKNILDYEEQVQEMEAQLKKYEYELSLYELQSPIYYIYTDSNVIYGFGKTSNEDVFRLVLITDLYENMITINYDSADSNKISSVTDSSENSLVFEYEENLLTITDSRDRKVKLSYNNLGNIVKIQRHDGRQSYYYYDGDKMIAVLDDSGFGAKITYQGQKVQKIESLSVLESVADGELNYASSFDFANTTDLSPYKKDEFVQFTFNNYKSTTISNNKGKDVTYIFDKYGKPTSVYEGHIASENDDSVLSPNVTSYEYSNEKISLSVKRLNNAENYLSNVSFNSSTLISLGALELGNFACGVEDVPYSYENYSKFHNMDSSLETKKDVVEMDQYYIGLINDNVKNCAHKMFVLSGWAKADSAYILDDLKDDMPSYITDRKFEIGAIIKYSDETSPRDPISKTFDWRNTEWQFCALPLKIEDKDVESIECYIDYSANTGNIEYTDLELNLGDFTRIDYDSQKRAVFVESGHSKWKTKYEYLGDTNLVVSESIYDESNPAKLYTTTYEYNKNKKLLKTIDYNGIVAENVYNDKGVVIKTLTYHVDEPTSKFVDEQEVDEKGNVTSDINEFGKKINTYKYISGTGIVSEVEDINGNTTAYGYDSADNLIETSLSCDGLSNSNTFGYTLDFLTSLRHNNFDIAYDYDSLGRISKIKIGGEEYLTKSYGEDEETTSLANNATFKQTFYDNGKVNETYYNNLENPIAQNIYDTNGNLVFVRDLRNGEDNVKTFKYYIDDFGNTYKEESEQGSTPNNDLDIRNVSITNHYDDNHENIIKSNISVGEDTYSYNYSYDNTPNAKMNGIQLYSGETQTFAQILNYDKLQRVNRIDTNYLEENLLNKEYEYLKFGERTSNIIAEIKYATKGVLSDNLKYKYDEKGNIVEIRHNNDILSRYKYDELSRLTREDNKLFGTTTTFAYGIGGNITDKKVYAFTLVENLDYEEVQQTTPYTYSISGWRDQLLKYKDEEFEYDAIGNPTKYRNKSLEWSYGRLLSKYDNKIQFVYNLNGIRTAKISDFTTRFFLNGNKIIEQVDSKNSIKFYYGAEGLTGFHLTSKDNKNDNIIDSDFFYKKNAQNDIIGIYNSEGKEIAKYYYDAWGNQKIKYLVETDSNTIEYVDIGEDFDYNDISNINRFIAYKNPFRYRSYYWDYETGLYYLNSRYYDPELGRFINADSISILSQSQEELNGLNLYAYCFNNPVNDYDELGFWSWKRLLKAVLVIAVVVVAVVVVAAVTAATGGSGTAVLIGAAVGAASGALSYSGQVLYQGITTGDWSWSWSNFLGATIGGTFGGMISIIPKLPNSIGAGIGGGLSSLFTDFIDAYVFEKDVSFKDSIFRSIKTAILSSIFSVIMGAIKVPEINKGRGSWQQIDSQLFTKLKNGTISNISLKSFFKLLGLDLYNGLLSNFIN